MKHLTKEKILKECGVINKDNLDVPEAVLDAMDIFAKQEAIALLRFADANGYTETREHTWKSIIDREEKTDDELYGLYLKSLTE